MKLYNDGVEIKCMFYIYTQMRQRWLRQNGSRLEP